MLNVDDNMAKRTFFLILKDALAHQAAHILMKSQLLLLFGSLKENVFAATQTATHNLLTLRPQARNSEAHAQRQH